MPEKDAHTKQAQHNNEFLEKIKPINFHDWMTVVMFYTALHYTDYFLAHFKNIHPINHNERIRLIASEKKLFSPRYFRSYQRLYDNSRIARYQPSNWELAITEDKIQLFLNDLDVIKNRAF